MGASPGSWTGKRLRVAHSRWCSCRLQRPIGLGDQIAVAMKCGASAVSCDLAIGPESTRARRWSGRFLFADSPTNCPVSSGPAPGGTPASAPSDRPPQTCPTGSPTPRRRFAGPLRMPSWPIAFQPGPFGPLCGNRLHLDREDETTIMMPGHDQLPPIQLVTPGRYVTRCYIGCRQRTNPAGGSGIGSRTEKGRDRSLNARRISIAPAVAQRQHPAGEMFPWP